MSISIQWFGRAWCKVKTQHSVIHIDPAYAKTYLADHEDRAGSLLDRLEEEADLVLVTHGHADHCKSSTIHRLCHADTLIVAPKHCVRKIGGDVKVIKPGDEITWEDVTIRAVDAYNTARAEKMWHPKGKGVGYLITVAGRTLYHAGDTEFIPEMRHLGPVNVAFLPIGGRFTMDIAQAVEAAMTIQPEVVIPIHTLKKADPHEFKHEVEARSDIEVVPLEIAGVYRLE